METHACAYLPLKISAVGSVTYLLFYCHKEKPLYIVDISTTTYLVPCHVNVVNECLLKGVKEGLASAVSLIRPFFKHKNCLKRPHQATNGCKKRISRKTCMFFFLLSFIGSRNS